MKQMKGPDVAKPVVIKLRKKLITVSYADKSLVSWRREMEASVESDCREHTPHSVVAVAVEH
jgi:hypothetical protein